MFTLLSSYIEVSQSAITCSNLAIATLEQGINSELI